MSSVSKPLTGSACYTLEVIQRVFLSVCKTCTQLKCKSGSFFACELDSAISKDSPCQAELEDI